MAGPDFEALRAERNAAMAALIRRTAAELGWDPDEVTCSFDPHACYCACPKGPCEHDFQGWREIENDDGEVCGGEQVCKRCGMGAMAHGIRTAE